MSAQPTEPKGNITVIPPKPKAAPRYVFDFAKLKRKDRTEFIDDIQKSINFKEAGLTPDDADKLALKWMTRLIVKWPAGFDLTDGTTFDDLSAIEWKEATTAFMSQFRTVFISEEPQG